MACPARRPSPVDASGLASDSPVTEADRLARVSPVPRATSRGETTGRSRGGAGSCGSGRGGVGLLEGREPCAVDPIPCRARIEAESPRGFAVAPRLRVDPGAVPADQRVGAKRPGGDGVEELIPRATRHRTLRLVGPPD